MLIVVSFLPYVIGFFAVATLTVLILGLLSMTSKGIIDGKYSNILMRWRVSLQGITLALLALHVAMTSIF